MAQRQPTKTRTPISDFLDELDSHGIYDLGFVTVHLREVGYTGPMPTGSDHAGMTRQIEARGLGGALQEEDYPGQRFVAGYEITAHVTRELTGTRPGAAFHGRGSAYRADLDALRSWEASR